MRAPVPSPRLEALRRKFRLKGSKTYRATEKYEQNLSGYRTVEITCNRGGDDFEVTVLASGWSPPDRGCGDPGGWDDFGAVIKRHGCWVNFELSHREEAKGLDALREACEAASY
jgi:hypothetical protein